MRAVRKKKNNKCECQRQHELYLALVRLLKVDIPMEADIADVQALSKTVPKHEAKKVFLHFGGGNNTKQNKNKTKLKHLQ